MAYLSRALSVFCLLSGAALGARLEGVHVVDRDYLLVHVVDGEVIHKDDGKGDGAFTSHGPHHNKDKVVRYGPALDVKAAVRPSSWRLTSVSSAETASAARMRRLSSL